MGACRETCNIFFYLKNYKIWKSFPIVLEKIIFETKLTYEDSFMPLVCKIKGHIL
jgi:hypothetical protein